MNRRGTVDLQALADSHEVPFVVIDRDRRIVAANSAFQRDYGTDAGPVQGQYCYRAIHGRDRPCASDGESCPHQRVFGAGERCTGLREHRDRGGRGRVLRQSATPLVTTDGEILMGKSLSREPASDHLEPLSSIEQRQIQRLLDLCNGNRRRVAEHLGISERTLYRRLKAYAAA